MIKKVLFLTIFLSVLFSNSKVCFGIFQEDRLSQAIQLFDNENFKAAEPLFKQLISENPESLSLYYYYGACRTENKNYSEYDLIQLLNANPSEAPLKINYYLAIQYQAQENWEQALKHFNKFRMNCSPELQEELSIAAKIQECYNHENPYKDLVKQVTESSLAQTETIFPDTAKGETKTVLKRDSAEFNPRQFIVEENPNTPKEESGTPIEFIVNSRITYFNTNHFQTNEGRLLFNESQQKQQRLDSILNKTDELREEYLGTNNTSDKNTLGNKIVTLETESYSLQQEITNLLIQTQNKELEYWNNASDNEIAEFTEKAETDRKNQEAGSNETQTDSPGTDSALINPELFLSEGNSDFLLEEPEQKDELIYRIQIGAYSKGLPAYVQRLYDKLSVLRKIENYTDENGVVVYTTGKLNNLEDAVKMQNQVRQEGIEDAYVVPYFNGKRITLNEAKKIANEL